MAFLIPKFTTPCLPHYSSNHDILTSRGFAIRHSRAISIACAVTFLILVYSVWPSYPDIKISRMRLNYLKIRLAPGPLIDLSLHLTVKIQNHDVYSMDYRTVDVAIAYREEVLGHVRSKDGHMWPLESSYVNADVDIDGARVLREVVPLLEDLLRGSVSLNTVTTVQGRLGLLFLDFFPIKAKISCKLIVNTRNHTVSCPNCYIDLRGPWLEEAEGGVGEDFRPSPR